MAERARDLWPDDFGPVEESSPGTLLREQAAQLGRKTNKVVEAEVSTDMDGDSLEYYFFLTAPVLSKYRYLLFKVRHPVSSPYPLQILHEGKRQRLDSQEEFMEKLKEIFASESTKKVIRTLIRESRP